MTARAQADRRMCRRGAEGAACPGLRGGPGVAQLLPRSLRGGDASGQSPPFWLLKT